MFNFSEKGKYKGNMASETGMIHDMSYWDTVLLPLFIVYFQHFELKIFLLSLKFVKSIATCFHGIFNKNLVSLFPRNCQNCYLCLW